MQEVASPKSVNVNCSHVRTGISGAGGVRSLEKNKATGDVSIVQFGGDSVLVNMCKYVAAGYNHNSEANIANIAIAICDIAQAILDEAFKRDVASDSQQLVDEPTV